MTFLPTPIFTGLSNTSSFTKAAWLMGILGMSLLTGCEDSNKSAAPSASSTPVTMEKAEQPTEKVSTEAAFEYEADQFEGLRVLRYQVPGFDQLDLQTKTLLYYLYEAALSGRDIMWDQNYRHNLKIRKLIEATIQYYPGDKSAEPYTSLITYAKQMWFASGIHHHYSSDKFTPTFSANDLKNMALAASEQSGFPINKATLSDWLNELKPVLFDPSVDAKKVNKAEDADKVADSAVNFYRNLTEKEVSGYYAKVIDKENKTPVSYGLNSQLVKENGEIKEKVWKVGGMYSPAIEKMVYWLEKAATVAENDKQKRALELLVKYYRTGDLRDFDEYNMAWVQDIDSQVDLIHGFIEVYNDPLAYRGSFEAVLSVRDPIQSKRIDKLAAEAQWFEDNSPIMDEHKKENVVGISAKAINVVVESGDASPTTPIGINLPNSNWIRADHGSKSVSLSNIKAAYDAMSGKAIEEFGYSDEEKARVKKYGELVGKLSTDLHEVIGHASGKLNEGVGTPKQTLKQYGSTLEEGRADLVALYFIADPKLETLGIVDNSTEIMKTQYDNYIRNGLMQQLRRIKSGDNVEQDHMRNRQLIAKWVYEKGLPDKVVEMVKRDDKTYIRINDYPKLRNLFGQLLREIQRIKSEGDYASAQALVENYGVKVDRELHEEVLDRYAKLNIPAYSGFINPKLTPVMDGEKITDVTISYPDDFMAQMFEYSETYGFLPVEN